MAVERTVHVVDDDAAVRRSLKWLLESAGLHAVTYETPSAFLAASPNLLSGCLLLDVKLPGIDGLELQAFLRQRHVSLPVIIMTAHGDVQSAVRALKAGAVDFIEKPYRDEVLLNAIEAALTKGGRTDLGREAADAAKRIATLTPRERDVLSALVMGHANKVIAYDLGISVRTVEVHRAHMMERLGVRQFAEAVRLAVLARMKP